MSRFGIGLVLPACLSGATLPAARTFDVVLRGGTILDGSGGRAYRADVGVLAGRIAAIGDLRGDVGTTDLDVSGLAVAPGFINIHSHPIDDGLTTAVNMLTQGVTTEMVNPDGGGPTDVAEQLARLASAGLAVNVGAHIGFNSVWTSVVGRDDRRPTADEVPQMRVRAERSGSRTLPASGRSTWASFTGLARAGTRGTLAVTVIVDRSAVSANGPAVIVQIEGRDPSAIAIAAPATP